MNLADEVLLAASMLRVSVASANAAEAKRWHEVLRELTALELPSVEPGRPAQQSNPWLSIFELVRASATAELLELARTDARRAVRHLRQMLAAVLSQLEATSSMEARVVDALVRVVLRTLVHMDAGGGL